MKMGKIKYVDKFILTLVVIIGLALMLAITIPKGTFVLFMQYLRTPVLDYIMEFFSFLGLGIMVIPVLIIVWRRCGLLQLIASGGTAIFLAIIVQFLKQTFNEPRPASALEFMPEPYPFSTPHELFSFPSGHSATAFFIATTLFMVFRTRKVLILAFIYATLVAISRIYLFQHFFVDTVVGAIIGISLGYLAFKTRVRCDEQQS
ncbi:MAG: phosphatase PAP2 family protein [Chlorobi bacterium]|nr:phosphatase PAP2 family protein [Chlorobiota bacterium]